MLGTQVTIIHRAGERGGGGRGGGGGVSGVTYPGPQGIIGGPAGQSQGGPPPPPLVFSGPMGPSNDMLPRASLRISPALIIHRRPLDGATGGGGGGGGGAFAPLPPNLAYPK